MNDIRKMVNVGGWSLIGFAVIFLGLQLILSWFFNYPAVLHGPGKEVFPVLLAGGSLLQFLLMIFALLPLLLIPASIASYYAFRDINEPGMRVGVIFATLASFALTLSLMRLPSLHFYMAKFFGSADASVGFLFQGTDLFLGVFLAGFFGKICLIVWFFIVSFAMLRARNFPHWMGTIGIITAIYLVLTLLSLFNVPAIINQVLGILSPLEFIWLFLFGIAMLYYKEPH